jgi:hypothetical protein
MASVSDPAALVVTRYARGAMVAAVVIAAFWHTGFDLPATITNWSSYQVRALAGGAWLAYLAIGVAGAVLLLRGQRPDWWAWPLAVGALGVAGLLVVASPAEMLSPANWAWGSIGWLAVILFWRHRLVHLVMFLAADAGLMLVCLGVTGAWDRVHLARAVMVLFGAAVLQVGYSVTAHSLSTVAARAVESAAARRKAIARQAAADAVHADRVERYDALRRSTATLLAELADGADPTDPVVQQRCAVEAARLRRLLAETDEVPDPLLHELRASADMAARNGVAVSLATVGDVPELPLEIRRGLCDAPLQALTAARNAARVTVVAGSDDVVVSVVADAPGTVSGHYPQVRLSQLREEDLLWVETRWPAR